jgi:hypothetical protein
MEFIRQFIQQYKSIPRKKSSTFWCNNVHDNVEYSLKVMDFIQKNIGKLEESLEIYLKKEINTSYFLRDWLQYGIKLVAAHVDVCYISLPPDTEEIWYMFFDVDHPTFEGYDICLQHAQKWVKERNEMYSMFKCDDKDILAIHENKKCDCWYMCSLCEEQEMRWKKMVDQRFVPPMNIFLNKEIQSAFVEAWLAKHSVNAIKKWPPTKVYYQRTSLQHRYYSAKQPITDFAEMCAIIKEDRKRYKEGGKTPIQCYENMPHDIQDLFHSIQINDSDFTIFMKLWSKLELVPIWLGYDKPRCKEILKML